MSDLHLLGTPAYPLAMADRARRSARDWRDWAERDPELRESCLAQAQLQDENAEGWMRKHQVVAERAATSNGSPVRDAGNTH